MSPKIFNETELIEIHNTSVDIPTTPKLTIYPDITETTHLTVPPPISSSPPLPHSLPILPYSYIELLQAFTVEFLCCIFNQLFSHLSPSPFIFCCGHLILILITYPVSGANMNAIMSLSLWIYEEEFTLIHTIRRWTYILVIQPLGTLCGLLLSKALITPNIKYIYIPNVKAYKIVTYEFIGTFVNIFCALHFIVSKYTRPTKELAMQFAMFGIACYFTMEMGRKENGGSGAVYNPTFYVIANAIAKYRGVVNENNVFKNWYCYVFPEIIGGLCAMVLFKFCFECVYYKLYWMKMKWEGWFFNKKYIL